MAFVVLRAGAKDKAEKSAIAAAEIKKSIIKVRANLANLFYLLILFTARCGQQGPL